jgi:hypothetical protein
VHRYKDLRNWWRNPHHPRIRGVRQVSPTDWVPQSKPIWFTEYGCAAVDKGTNQPNKFLDPKSVESRLPYFSTGARDGLIQMQYLRAMSAYWRDPERNPVSEEYEGRMIDMGRAFAWTWDTRPYPFFPNTIEKWSDGRNYARGHWLNGRTSSRSLASVVREICSAAGLEAFSTDGLWGYVRGYAVDRVGDARAALQPLMIRHGFDAVEREGQLVFRSRDGDAAVALDPATLAVSDELEGTTVQTREAEAEVSGRVRVRFVEADADFEVIAEEAVLADEAIHAVTATEFDMALTRGEGRAVAERWLSEARVAREGVTFALPPSQRGLGAGDVVELPGDGEEGPGRYRIDRVEEDGLLIVEAVRIEPEVYAPRDPDEPGVSLRSFTVPLPVEAHFLDLPLLRGDENPVAPYVAAHAAPWPGGVALYQSAQDADYRLNTVLQRQAVTGMSETALPAARTGLVQRGLGLKVRLRHGALQSIPDAALLSGGNVAALGDGSTGRWEVFQFGKAELIGPQTYRLHDLLRGQAGSDALMPPVWPKGSIFVLLDGAPEQIGFTPAQRGVTQHFRLGPANRPLDDASFRHRVEVIKGNGLRPLAPCHPRVKTEGGDLSFGWIRRTRIDGDGWERPEVPLGEERESYLVQVVAGGMVRRQEIVAVPEWDYPAANRAADGLAGVGFELSVAQVSAQYGPGPSRKLTVGP